MASGAHPKPAGCAPDGIQLRTMPIHPIHIHVHTYTYSLTHSLPLSLSHIHTHTHTHTHTQAYRWYHVQLESSDSMLRPLKVGRGGTSLQLTTTWLSLPVYSYCKAERERNEGKKILELNTNTFVENCKHSYLSRASDQFSECLC